MAPKGGGGGGGGGGVPGARASDPTFVRGSVEKKNQSLDPHIVAATGQPNFAHQVHKTPKGHFYGPMSTTWRMLREAALWAARLVT